MTRFCTADAADGYWWCRGGPWTGKTALLAWFVLNPPPGVQVVAFFVTGRYAGHNDAAAFTTPHTRRTRRLQPRDPAMTQRIVNSLEHGSGGPPHHASRPLNDTSGQSEGASVSSAGRHGLGAERETRRPPPTA